MINLFSFLLFFFFALLSLHIQPKVDLGKNFFSREASELRDQLFLNRPLAYHNICTWPAKLK